VLETLSASPVKLSASNCAIRSNLCRVPERRRVSSGAMQSERKFFTSPALRLQTNLAPPHAWMLGLALRYGR